MALLRRREGLLKSTVSIQPTMHPDGATGMILLLFLSEMTPVKPCAFAVAKILQRDSAPSETIRLSSDVRAVQGPTERLKLP